MKKYKALQMVPLTTGTVRVTDAQANCRRRCLKAIAGDEYLIVDACNFRAGEEFFCNDLGRHRGVRLIAGQEGDEDTQNLEKQKLTKKARKK